MNTNGTPTSHVTQCALGVSSEELSTWLADGLDEPNARRVGAHAPTCEACQAHLAAYNMVDTALRSQSVPYDEDSLWEQLRPRLLQTEQQPHIPRASSGWRAGIAGLAAIAAILLLLVGFFQLFRNQSSIMPALTPAPTLAPVPLDWTAATFPPGSVLAYGHTLAVPVSDGNTAYACAITLSKGAATTPATGSIGDTPSGIASMWVTHDRAAHWTQTHALPAVGHAVNSCSIIVDDYQPSTALVVVSWSEIPVPEVSADVAASFVTTDGGASWHQVADPSAVNIGRILTANGRTYALLNHTCTDAQPRTIENDCLWHLYPITDSWQIGQPVDQAISTDSLMGIRGLWADRSSGAIWVEVPERHATISQLWKSADGGAHWQHVKVPVVYGVLGQLSADGRTLYLCGSKYAGDDPQNPQHGPFRVYCSSDGGASWHERSMLTASPKGASVSLYTVTSDGTILGSVTDGDMRTLYRLTSTSTQWQSLGEVPGGKGSAPLYQALLNSALLYRNGVFWAEPISPATFVPTLPLNNAVFTAAYP